MRAFFFSFNSVPLVRKILLKLDISNVFVVIFFFPHILYLSKRFLQEIPSTIAYASPSGLRNNCASTKGEM